MSDDINRFKRAFGYGEAGPAGSDCRAAAQAWSGSTRSIKNQLSQLRTALLGAFSDDAVGSDVASRFDAKVAAFTGMLDGQLGDALSAAADGAGTPNAGKLEATVRGLVRTYAALVDNKTLIDIDENPFAPLSIRSTLSGVLAQVPERLRAG